MKQNNYAELSGHSFSKITIKMPRRLTPDRPKNPEFAWISPDFLLEFALLKTVSFWSTGLCTVAARLQLVQGLCKDVLRRTLICNRALEFSILASTKSPFWYPKANIKNKATLAFWGLKGSAAPFVQTI